MLGISLSIDDYEGDLSLTFHVVSLYENCMGTCILLGSIFIYTNLDNKPLKILVYGLIHELKKA